MSIYPKPPAWRLYVSNSRHLEFTGLPPSRRRCRALKRWFGWRVQLRQIDGTYIDA
jgi:hypothetical protein